MTTRTQRIFGVGDRETGHIIEDNLTLTMARNLIAKYERSDRKNDAYTPGFYAVYIKDGKGWTIFEDYRGRYMDVPNKKSKTNDAGLPGLRY